MTRPGRRPSVVPSSRGAAVLIHRLAYLDQSHSAAASALGIAQSRLSRILSGEYTITLAEAVRVRELYGVDLADWAKPT